MKEVEIIPCEDLYSTLTQVLSPAELASASFCVEADIPRFELCSALCAIHRKHTIGSRFIAVSDSIAAATRVYGRAKAPLQIYRVCSLYHALATGSSNLQETTGLRKCDKLLSRPIVTYSVRS